MVILMFIVQIIVLLFFTPLLLLTIPLHIIIVYMDRILNKDKPKLKTHPVAWVLLVCSIVVFLFAYNDGFDSFINKDKVYMAENYIDAGPTMKSFYWNKLTKEEQERAIRMEKQYSNNK